MVADGDGDLSDLPLLRLLDDDGDTYGDDDKENLPLLRLVDGTDCSVLPSPMAVSSIPPLVDLTCRRCRT